MHKKRPKYIQNAMLLVATLMFVTGCGSGEAEGEHDGHGHGHEHGEGGPSAAEIMASHEHANPDETCFMCDASKREKGRLWCKEHVRYEDRCWYCHPELEEEGRMFCKEHFLYEDECHLCHPELKEGGEGAAGDEQASGRESGNNSGAEQAQASSEQKPGGLFCKEHGVYEIECGICQPDLAGTMEPGANLKIRFASDQSAQKAGVRTSRPQVGESAPAIDAICEVQYNENEMAQVTPLAGGVIREVMFDVGQEVNAGDALVRLHSAQVATVKSDYLGAVVQRDIRQQEFDRQQQLREQNISAEKDFLRAQAQLREAGLAVKNHRQRLLNLGFSQEEVEQIEKSEDTSATLVIRAPFDGTLIERHAVVGEAIEMGHPLFTLADLSTRWLKLSVKASQLGQLEIGQAVEARFEALPGQTIQGKVTWIDSSIDPRTRMVRARALVTDDAGVVKTGLYGNARILTGQSQPATIVPREAVQRHENAPFVFVRNSDDLYSLRRVAVGSTRGDSVEVIAGLDQSDEVVTTGSFIVMSEFLKSRLGAGCADH
jgi:cobalt-zinc-cadmium efflux system membrane fusion protein